MRSTPCQIWRSLLTDQAPSVLFKENWFKEWFAALAGDQHNRADRPQPTVLARAKEGPPPGLLEQTAPNSLMVDFSVLIVVNGSRCVVLLFTASCNVTERSSSWKADCGGKEGVAKLASGWEQASAPFLVARAAANVERGCPRACARQHETQSR